MALPQEQTFDGTAMNRIRNVFAKQSAHSRQLSLASGKEIACATGTCPHFSHWRIRCSPFVNWREDPGSWALPLLCQKRVDMLIGRQICIEAATCSVPR